jgi:hypothetical protein
MIIEYFIRIVGAHYTKLTRLTKNKASIFRNNLVYPGDEYAFKENIASI